MGGLTEGDAWAHRTPTDARSLMADYPGTWWIAGGWALEAFTGVRRPHVDLDLSVLRAELTLLRRHLAGRLDVWTATRGVRAPLPAAELEASPDDVLPDGCGQVWTRRSAADPWEYDVLLVPGSATDWVYTRDTSIGMPLADALWARDGVRYLRPEIQLLYKAPGRREKDQTDFTATLPHLDVRRRAWLGEALAKTVPGHPWLGALGG